MGLLPTQRSKMRSRTPHTCAAAATTTSSLPPSNRQRPLVAAFLLLSFLAPANAGVSYRFVLDFAREGQVGAGVGINSRRFSTGKNKDHILWVVDNNPASDTCADKCLESDECKGFYRWETQDTQRIKCAGLNDIGNGEGVLTGLKDWSYRLIPPTTPTTTATSTATTSATTTTTPTENGFSTSVTSTLTTTAVTTMTSTPTTSLKRVIDFVYEYELELEGITCTNEDGTKCTAKRFAEGKAFDNIIAKITGKKDAELGATFEACKERCTAEGDGCTAIYLFKTKQGVPKCNVLALASQNDDGSYMAKLTDLRDYSYVKVRSGTTPTFTLTTTPTTSTTLTTSTTGTTTETTSTTATSTGTTSATTSTTQTTSTTATSTGTSTPTSTATTSTTATTTATFTQTSTATTTATTSTTTVTTSATTSTTLATTGTTSETTSTTETSTGTTSATTSTTATTSATTSTTGTSTNTVTGTTTTTPTTTTTGTSTETTSTTETSTATSTETTSTTETSTGTTSATTTTTPTPFTTATSTGTSTPTTTATTSTIVTSTATFTQTSTATTTTSTATTTATTSTSTSTSTSSTTPTEASTETTTPSAAVGDVGDTGGGGGSSISPTPAAPSPPSPSSTSASSTVQAVTATDAEGNTIIVTSSNPPPTPPPPLTVHLHFGTGGVSEDAQTMQRNVIEQIVLASGVDAAALDSVEVAELTPWFTVKVVVASHSAADAVLAQASSSIGISIVVQGASYKANAWVGLFEDFEEYELWYGASASDLAALEAAAKTMTTEVTAGVAVGGGCVVVFMVMGLVFLARRDSYADDADGIAALDNKKTKKKKKKKKGGDLHVFGGQRFGSSSSMHYHPTDNDEESTMESKKLFGRSLSSKAKKGGSFGFAMDGTDDMDEYIAIESPEAKQRRRSSYLSKPGRRGSDSVDVDEYIAVHGGRRGSLGRAANAAEDEYIGVSGEDAASKARRRSSYLGRENSNNIGDDEYIALNDGSSDQQTRRASYLALGSPSGAGNDKGPLQRQGSGWSISDILRGGKRSPSITESNHYVEADETVVSPMGAGGGSKTKKKALSKKEKAKRPDSWDMSPLVLRWGGEVDLDAELANLNNDQRPMGESDGVGQLLSDTSPNKGWNDYDNEDEGNDDPTNTNRTFANPTFGLKAEKHRPHSRGSTVDSHGSGLTNAMYNPSEVNEDALSSTWGASDHWGNQLTFLDGWAETETALTFLFDVGGSSGVPTQAPPTNGMYGSRGSASNASLPGARSAAAAPRVYSSTAATPASSSAATGGQQPRVYPSTMASERKPIQMTMFDGNDDDDDDDVDDDDDIHGDFSGQRQTPGNFEKTYGNSNGSDLLVTSGTSAVRNNYMVASEDEPFVHVAAGNASDVAQIKELQDAIDRTRREIDNRSAALKDKFSEDALNEYLAEPRAKLARQRAALASVSPTLSTVVENSNSPAAIVNGHATVVPSTGMNDVQGLLDRHLAESEQRIASTLRGGKLLKDLNVQEVGMLVEHILKGELGQVCRTIFTQSYVSGALLETYGIEDFMEIKNSNGQSLHRPMARQLKIHIDAFRANGVPATMLVQVAGGGGDGRQGRAGLFPDQDDDSDEDLDFT